MITSIFELKTEIMIFSQKNPVLESSHEFCEVCKEGYPEGYIETVKKYGICPKCEAEMTEVRNAAQEDYPVQYLV